MPRSFLANSGFTIPFANRREAGEKLAQAILAELEQVNEAGVSYRLIVYALPRGGLPVAEPIARLLHCPLDVIAAKKITRPDNPELAIGAVTADGHTIWARSVFDKREAEPYENALHHAHTQAQIQMERFAENRSATSAEGAIALIVDDGIATGMTIAAAAQSLREQHPTEIWICAPVAPAGIEDFLSHWCDRVILLETPESFQSVSRFYQEFAQVETEEAIACLQGISD
jgi:putative phosphoribosyl transferase